MIKEAIIIAGGKGTRLIPLTLNKPKALVMINNQPLIERQVEHYSSQGITHFVLALGCMSDKVKKWAKLYGRAHNLTFNFSCEKMPLGTGGALKEAMKFLIYDEPFLCINCDDLTNIQITDLNKVLSTNKNVDGVIAISNPISSFGIVKYDDKNNLITNFGEKQRMLDVWVSCGTYLFRHSIKDLLPEIGNVETKTFPKASLLMMKHHDFWQPINSLKDIEEMRKKNDN